MDEATTPGVTKTTETTIQTGPASVPPVTKVTEKTVLAPPTTPGWQTSEFLLSALGAIIGAVLCFHPKDSMNEYGVMLIGSCVVGYAFSRGVAKIKTPTA